MDMRKKSFFIENGTGYVFPVPRKLAWIVIALSLSGCTPTLAVIGLQSATGKGEEYNQVFKVPMKKAEALAKRVLKARQLEVKDTNKEKNRIEIYASNLGAKISVTLEPIGPSTKITVWSKMYRFVSDDNTSKDILTDIGNKVEAYRKSKTASLR